MSEIKVGDRVRIVQIIVKCDNSNRFPVARAKHLGREGIVTSTLPLDENSYAVLLSGSSLSNLFYHEELELLSVDNEHEEPSAAQLRNDYDDLIQWYKHLYERNEGLVKVNEWLTTECRELHVMGKRQREENTHLVAKIVELQKKYDGITKPRDMSEGRAFLFPSVTITRSKRVSAIRSDSTWKPNFVLPQKTVGLIL